MSDGLVMTERRKKGWFIRPEVGRLISKKTRHSSVVYAYDPDYMIMRDGVLLTHVRTLEDARIYMRLVEDEEI